ncbi:MAG TPA: fibronectin type III domain-containing protein [Pyrinomonadaceae bacterium]|nr:fibronectin type III domain-containing protein [Pyrinomonadaceae bacterium]HMP66782.1 fibronectin type III domain-containing protein [Pyrinomonadaceae bacterium]
MKKLVLLVLPVLVLAIFAFPAMAQRAEMARAEAEMAEPPKEDETLFYKEEKDRGHFNRLITAATYPFSVGSGVLVDMSEGTTQLVGPSLDDTASPVTPIGFVFRYDGVNHTQFSVNANGLARLGPLAVTTVFNNGTGFATATNEPKIAPYFDDLCTGSDGRVHYKVIGDAPNRTLVVEWFNMKITRAGTCTGAVGNGTFQMWLHETTGVIEFVYGAIPAASATDGGYTIGLQAGAASNFASVTTAAGTVSYDVHNFSQLDAIPAGTKYTFAPNIPAAPTGMNFTDISATGLTVNWTDNATNETGYEIERSIDGVNYSLRASLAANAESFADTGLFASSTYFYRVRAISEGAGSGALSGSQTTNAAGSINSVASGGPWSEPSTWVGGVVPTASDIATIVDGATVTIDANGTAYRINVGTPPPAGRSDSIGKFGIPGALLQFEADTARTLTVTENVIVNPSGTFRSANSGAVTGHVLSVGSSVENNGVLDFSTNANTAGAGITFTGEFDASFFGSGATTDVRTVTLNKASRDVMVDLFPANFSVAGSETDTAASNFLTLTSGTLKVSGTFTGSHRTFAGGASYSVGANGGFWLDNPNYTVTGQGGTPTWAGAFRISDGTFNVGTGSGNSLHFTTGANVLVEGGAVNSTGRFGVSSTTQVITYNQTGGTVTVQTVGHASTTQAGFDMGTAAGSFVAISGGSIVIQNPSTAASGPRDYRMQSGSAATSGGTASITGGTLQIGNDLTAAPGNFSIQGVVPNLVIDNSVPGHNVTFGAASVWNNITRDILVNSGATLNFGTAVFLFNGLQLVNNGTITHNATGSRFIFFRADAVQTYSGSGTVTAPMTSFEAQNGGVVIDPGVQNIVVRRIILFVGGITNTNKLTVGNNDASLNNIQFGNTSAGAPTDAGVFDTSPVFDLGTGGLNISYLRTVNQRSTGAEIPANRTITNLVHDNNDPTHVLTIEGGDLTVSGILALTNGVIRTESTVFGGGGNTLIHSGATVTRTTGFVEGRLARPFSAPGTYTFHVGRGVYSPTTATVTAVGTSPSTLTAEAFSTVPSGFDPARTAARHWSLTETGDLTANLTFTVPAADVNGDASDYRVYRGFTNMCAGGPCYNTGTNVAGPVNDVTEFSLWSVGELQEPSLPASATIIGRALRANGTPIQYATITLSGGGLGTPIVARTNGFGYYWFVDLPTGVTYTVTAEARSFTFTNPSVQVFLTNDIGNLNFLAQP